MTQFAKESVCERSRRRSARTLATARALGALNDAVPAPERSRPLLSNQDVQMKISVDGRQPHAQGAAYKRVQASRALEAGSARWRASATRACSPPAAFAAVSAVRLVRARFKVEPLRRHDARASPFEMSKRFRHAGEARTSASQVLGLLVNGEYTFLFIALRLRLLPTRARVSFASDMAAGPRIHGPFRPHTERQRHSSCGCTQVKLS